MKSECNNMHGERIKISLEEFTLKQNSKYPTTVFIVVSNLWFY